MALDQNTLLSIKKQIPQQTRTQIQKEFGASFQKLKNKMVAEFLNHPITLEIKAGVNASNISGTLGGGSGNLFSFIGFDSGADPTKPIEEILNETRFQFSRVTNRSIEFSINLPNAKEIFAVTPMPWAPGRSWAKGIESGISGLGYYLKIKTDNSRSGLGIQSPRKVRKSSSKFQNTQYISALLKKYQKEFENLRLS